MTFKRPTSAGLTALAVGLFATTAAYAAPTINKGDNAWVMTSAILVLLMTVLGGAGTLWGPALGAVILVPLSEYSRIWFGGTGRTVDLIIYGILIVLICMFRPRGLLSLIEDRLRRREGG